MTLLGEQIALPITTLKNKSIGEGIVPDETKITKVILVYKSKATNEYFITHQYRCYLQFVKYWEKLYKEGHNYDFIQKNNTLKINQYSFREKHSTINAVTAFTSDVVMHLIKKDSIVSVILDLSKTFDTINHHI